MSRSFMGLGFRSRVEGSGILHHITLYGFMLDYTHTIFYRV